jgi:hypothetical protein
VQHDPSVQQPLRNPQPVVRSGTAGESGRRSDAASLSAAFARPGAGALLPGLPSPRSAPFPGGAGAGARRGGAARGSMRHLRRWGCGAGGATADAAAASRAGAAWGGRSATGCTVWGGAGPEAVRAAAGRHGPLRRRVAACGGGPTRIGHAPPEVPRAACDGPARGPREICGAAGAGAWSNPGAAAGIGRGRATPLRWRCVRFGGGSLMRPRASARRRRSTRDARRGARTPGAWAPGGPRPPGAGPDRCRACAASPGLRSPGFAFPGQRGASCGGRTLTGACCTACCTTGRGIWRAAGATGSALAKTRAGTTVVAFRLVKRWSRICGGGSALPRPAAALAIGSITERLTLAMLMLRM